MLKIWHIYSLLIISWHTDVKEALRKKNQGNKIRDSGETYDIN